MDAALTDCRIQWPLCPLFYLKKCGEEKINKNDASGDNGEPPVGIWGRLKFVFVACFLYFHDFFGGDVYAFDNLPEIIIEEVLSVVIFICHPE